MKRIVLIMLLMSSLVYASEFEFGDREEAGVSTLTIDETMQGFLDTCTGTGTVDSIVGRVQLATGATHTNACILFYKSSDDSYVGKSEELEIEDGNQLLFRNFTPSGTISLEVDVEYKVMLWGDDPGAYVFVANYAGCAGGDNQTLIYNATHGYDYASPPNPLTGYSSLANYTTRVTVYGTEDATTSGRRRKVVSKQFMGN